MFNFLNVIFSVMLCCFLVSSPSCSHLSSKNQTLSPDSFNLQDSVGELFISANVIDVEAGTEGIADIVKGTAFSVHKNLLVTAGHLCESAIKYEGKLRLEYMKSLTDKEVIKDIIIIKVDTLNDLCLLGVKDNLLKPLKIAQSGPSFNERIYVYGSPLFEHNILTEGYFGYIKRDIRPYGVFDRYVFSCLVTLGNSGSPVLNKDGEVISVLSANIARYPLLSFGPTLDTLKDLIHLEE